MRGCGVRLESVFPSIDSDFGISCRFGKVLALMLQCHLAGTTSMQINLATIRHHADEKLRRIETQPGPAERLAALRKFLKIEAQRLHLRHRFGIGGGQIVSARSLIVDMVIQRAAEASGVSAGAASGEGLALVALGGYGRQELAPHSDIDILFLHHGRREAAAATALNESILYLLWDAGFSVGHSVRSLGDCVSIAREDIVSRNSLIDARLIWGSDGLFAELRRRLDEEVFEKRKKGLLDELLEEREERYSKFGRVVCLQEPNVKETAGGLRDLHVLQWAARIAYGSGDFRRLAEAGEIPARDARAMRASYEYLLRVRNDLHFQTGRRTDLLSLDLQQQAAHSLGYEDTAEQQASEIFMRDYYLRGHSLHRLSDAHLKRALKGFETRSWFTRARVAPAIGGFVMRDGLLDLEPGSADSGAGSDFSSGERLDAGRMMMAFGYAQATGATLGLDLQQAIQRSLPAVSREFRASREAAEGFLRIMRSKGRVAAGLRLMHDLDFLGKYLPEFGRVTCMVQHDLYHRYTVDEHTLRTIEVLDELANSKSRQLERYRNILGEVDDAWIVYLGLLFHDIGKGLGGGHTEKGVAIAGKVCDRLGLDRRDTERIVFLVRHHLTMSHISQRRDLADEKVIRDFAATVGALDRLNMLALLTYADINGVGPAVWNEWKDVLLWELYSRTREVLEPESRRGEAAESRTRIASLLGNEVEEAEVRRHFEQLPADYLRFTPLQTVVEHIRLAHTLNSRGIRTSWKVDPKSRCTDLHLCARDRTGLFASIAGALTAQGIYILSVHLNTRADGLAIDSFKVRDSAGEPINDPAKWEMIDNTIRRALDGELDVAAAVSKRLRAQGSSRLARRRNGGRAVTTIAWDNGSSGRSTILEVRTGDRMGLAYRISSTLASLGLDIVFAKVATEKNLALDVFYVTTAAGEKLKDDQLPVVEEAVKKALLPENDNPEEAGGKQAGKSGQSG